MLESVAVGHLNVRLVLRLRVLLVTLRLSSLLPCHEWETFIALEPYLVVRWGEFRLLVAGRWELINIVIEATGVLLWRVVEIVVEDVHQFLLLDYRLFTVGRLQLAWLIVRVALDVLLGIVLTHLTVVFAEIYVVLLLHQGWVMRISLIASRSFDWALLVFERPSVISPQILGRRSIWAGRHPIIQ